jgi:penicillin V acylase-like amidase (Ntn superfamily)
MKTRSILIAATIAASATLSLGGGREAAACSLIFWNDNGQAMVAARTMDLYISDEPRLVYLPRGIARTGAKVPNAERWTSKYASVGLTALDAATSDGVNEAGLSVHLLYLHGSVHEPVDQRPAVSNALWPQFVLDNYKTVAEALDGLQKVQIVSARVHDREWPLHLSIEDSTGDSAVLEFVDGKLVVHHGKDVTVMTNEPPLADQLVNLKRYKEFGGTLAMPGDIDPLSRFVRASSYLKTLPKPASTREAVGMITGVLRSVAVPFGAADTSGGESTDSWPTRWGTVTDHTHKVYYVMPVGGPNVYWVDLAKLAPTSKKILALDPHDPTLVGEVSSRFETFGPTSKAFPPTM